MSNKELVSELLKGGYDLHVHPSPSHFNRSLDDFDLVRQCDEAGMAGAMIKSHYDVTAGRAIVANKYAGAKAKLYGGMVLNWPVGGLNPYAVAAGLKMGVRIVWMPTRDSENCLKYGHMNGDFFDRPPISIWDENGKLKPVLDDIFALVKEHNAWLATGHLSVEESLLLCKEARAQGVNTIMTHPDWSRTTMPLEQQLQLAKMGVLIEKVWLNVSKNLISAPDMAHSMKVLGAENVYMVTDLGQAGGQRPVDGMREFVSTMLDQGIAPEAIKTMLCTNPHRIAEGG